MTPEDKAHLTPVLSPLSPTLSFEIEALPKSIWSPLKSHCSHCSYETETDRQTSREI